MTGIPQFNFPLFDRAAAVLRAAGFHVISPAELDAGPVRDAALASPDGKLVDGGVAGKPYWGDLLARDVRIVGDECDAVCLLPNWHRSKGAKVEALVGILAGHSFYRWYEPPEGEPGALKVPTVSVAFKLAETLMEGWK